MSNYRLQRTESLIREELNGIIMRELEFNGALATIMSVEVSKGLNKAAVKLGVLPPEKAAEVLTMLSRNRDKIQYLLLKKINIKPMPKIFFEIEKSQAEA